ncbi:MAG: glycosyltransferase 87 family protein [Nostocoides sp.]
MPALTRLSRRARWALAILLIALAALPVLARYLVFWPADQWQVDVAVYRMAGESVLVGRPVYAAMTEAPQLLPFTYPPFAALLAVPLALMPFGLVGWLWSIAQVTATAATVWLAGQRFIRRTGSFAPLAWALLIVPMLWLHPVSDGVRFGQVNAFLVLAVVLDLARPRWVRRLPVGMLVGFATAIKLTPAVFIVHFLICRRWRAAITATATAAGATVFAWLVLPAASFAFWGGVLQDPSRLGPNRGTSNQSMRGVLLRIGPDGLPGTAIWLLLALLVAWVGFTLARRYYLLGDWVGQVATVGLIALLVSPVSWIHHYQWMIVIIPALLGRGPDHLAKPWPDIESWWRATFAGPDNAGTRYAAIMTIWFLCRGPWWGISLVAQGAPWVVLGRVLQNIDCCGALLALAMLWRLAAGRWRPAADRWRPGIDPAEPNGTSARTMPNVSSSVNAGSVSAP